MFTFYYGISLRALILWKSLIFRQNKFLKDKKLRDQNNGRLKMKPDMKL